MSDRVVTPIMGRCQSCGHSVHLDDVADDAQQLDGGACPFCGEGHVGAVAWGGTTENLQALAPTRPTGRACIFCGCTPLTREHLWPQWISRTFPELRRPGNQNRVIVRKRTAPFGAGYVRIAGEETRQRGGNSADRQIRAVCGSCNNGWMAELEGAAQPILTRLATDPAAVPGEFDASVVTRWLAKTTAVFEWDDPESAMLPQWALDAIAANDESALRKHWAVFASWLLEPSFGMSRGILHGRDPDADTDEVWSGLLQLIAIKQAGFVTEFDPTGDILPNLGFEPPTMRALWPHLDGRRRPVMTREEWRFIETLGPVKAMLAARQDRDL